MSSDCVPPSQVSPMTCFRRKEGPFVLTAQRSYRRVPVLHRIPLFSRTRMRVHLCIWVAHLPQSKPDLSRTAKWRGFLFRPMPICSQKIGTGQSNCRKGGNNRQSSIKGLCKGDYTNQVIQTHSACFFLASCWSRRWFAKIFFSAFRCL